MSSEQEAYILQCQCYLLEHSKEQENKEHMQSEEHMSCKGINNLAYIGPRIQNGSY